LLWVHATELAEFYADNKETRGEPQPAGAFDWALARTAISIPSLTCTAARGRHSTDVCLVFIKRTQTEATQPSLPRTHPPTPCMQLLQFQRLFAKRAREEAGKKLGAAATAAREQINRPWRPQQQQQFRCLVRLGAAALTSPSEGPHQDNGPQAVRKAHHGTKQSAARRTIITCTTPARPARLLIL